MPFINKNKQCGLSLVELMIALALGVVLTLGLVQVFNGVRTTFSVAEGSSRLQESSRFAMEFLKRDLRMAGQYGCFNEYAAVGTAEKRFYNHMATNAGTTAANYDTAPYNLRFHRPLEVFDYIQSGGTSPGNTLTAALAELPAGVSSGTSYSPTVPAELGVLGTGAGAAVPGSDVVLVRYLDEISVALPAPVGAAGEAGLNQTNGQIYMDGTGLQRFGIYGLTNCKDVSLFQLTQISPSVLSWSGGLNVDLGGGAYWDAREIYGVGSLLYRYRTAVYYVGRRADGLPSLFRRRLNDSPTSANEGDDWLPAEELVPDVEMMQVLLGVDTNPELATPLPQDDIVKRYRSSQEHSATGDFARQTAVKSMRLSLLVRSSNPVPDGKATATPLVVGDVTVTPPGDRRLRHVYDATIAVRNRVRN